MDYPPSGHIMAVVIMNENYDLAKNASEKMKEFIENHKKDINFCYDDLNIIGPTDAGISKVNDVYRRVIYIKSPREKDVIDIKNQLEEDIQKNELMKKMRIHFDLNPMSSY